MAYANVPGDHKAKDKRLYDALNMRVPDQVLILLQSISWGFSYSKTNLNKAYKNPRKVYESSAKFCRIIYFNAIFIAGTDAPVGLYDALNPPRRQVHRIRRRLFPAAHGERGYEARRVPGADQESHGIHCQCQEGQLDVYDLHVAIYLNPKQFDQVCWFALKMVVEAAIAKGIRPVMYLENDWRLIRAFWTEEIIQPPNHQNNRQPAGCIQAFCGQKAKGRMVFCNTGLTRGNF